MAECSFQILKAGILMAMCSVQMAVCTDQMAVCSFQILKAVDSAYDLVLAGTVNPKAVYSARHLVTAGFLMKLYSSCELVIMAGIRNVYMKSQCMDGLNQTPDRHHTQT